MSALSKMFAWRPYGLYWKALGGICLMILCTGFLVWLFCITPFLIAGYMQVSEIKTPLLVLALGSIIGVVLMTTIIGTLVLTRSNCPNNVSYEEHLSWCIELALGVTKYINPGGLMYYSVKWILRFIQFISWQNFSRNKP